MKQRTNMILTVRAAVFLSVLLAVSSGPAQEIFLEAESFEATGGWVIDQEFMDEMGSPFLLAHGLGAPVADAATTVTFPAAGEYTVWVRTRDWVATWDAPGAPGRFQVVIDGQAVPETFGAEGARWHWQNGGRIRIDSRKVKVALHDLTGFEGRCDAICLAADSDFTPPADEPELTRWRRRLLGIPEQALEAGHYDLVVVGAGMAGLCASVQAARLGLSVALVQDRPVVGGNNSSEVRVWLNGDTNFEPYPNIGNLVREFEPARRFHYGPQNTADIYEDQKRIEMLKSEKNLSLFLNCRVNQVEAQDGTIQVVTAQHIVSGRRLRFAGTFFADCTGDGSVGYLAGADYDMTLDGHMGRCNLWNVIDTGKPAPFPRCPWALDLSNTSFPAGELQLGGWYWESGFYHDPFEKGEYIRDWNFRAMYGAWDELKNRRRLYPNHRLNWAAYVSGKRESRRLLGDIILDEADLVNGIAYPDGCVPCTWKIDLHLPDLRYNQGFEKDAFISKAYYTDYQKPYWIPYRCLYSRNVDNLFMAGRDISVTHRGLGAVRVMRTGGMMGEIVGMAAWLCKKHDTRPRGIYMSHLSDLQKMMRRSTDTEMDVFGENLALSAAVEVSSHYDRNTYPAAYLNDGIADTKDNALRWLSSASSTPDYLTFTWEGDKRVSAMRVVSGYYTGGVPDAPIRDLHLEYRDDAAWKHVEGGAITGNTRVERVIRFAPVVSRALRLVVTRADGDISRIWEVEFYDVPSDGTR